MAEFQKLFLTRSIFVTWHESCFSGRYAHEPQLSLLLSAQALVVSVRPYFKDETEYRGFANFAPSGRLLAEIEQPASMSPRQGMELAFNRTSAFAQKFAPARILREAGLFSSLDRLR